MLLSAPTGSIGREEVAEELWPDFDSLAAHRNVRSAVSGLRALLGNSTWVYLEGPVVTLALPAGSRDDVAFEESARRALHSLDDGDIRSAIGLYGGTYLADDRYNDWTVYRRDTLAGLRRNLIMHVLDRVPSDGPGLEITGWLQDLVRDDPCDEYAARRLMSIYMESSRRMDAIRLYRRVERELRRELEIDPETETRELFRRAERAGC